VDIETIRQELEFNTGRFPADAVRAAIEQREAMTPVLLAALQEAADAPEKLEREPYPMLHMYASNHSAPHGICAPTAQYDC